MALEVFADYALTTVSSGGTTAPSSGSTETWTVGSSASFPAAVTGVSQFHVADPALPTENILVTNVSGTTWSVTRGAEGTTPVAHAGGFTVKAVVSPGFLGLLPQWVNVTSSLYGADRTGTNDSTTAIGNAVSAATTAKVPVYFPAGTYKITAALNWKIPGLVVIGDGSQTTVIKQYTSNTPVIELAGQGQRIQGLRLEYSSQQNGSDTLSLGITFGDATVGSCFMSIFEDLYVFQAYTGLGIPAALSSSLAGGLFSCTLRNIHVLGYYHHGIGLDANGGGGHNDCTGCVFENIYIENNSGGSNANCDSYPLYLAGWTEVEFYQLNIEHGNSYEFGLIQCSQVGTCVINGLHIEGMNINGVSGTSALINADDNSTIIVDGMTVYNCQLVGTVQNAVAQFSTAGPSSVIIRGYNESPGPGGSVATHPWADFGGISNCTFTIEGVVASLVTPPLVINSATGCFYRIGPPNIWTPQDNNLLLATGDPWAATTNNTLVAGTLYLVKLPIRYALTLTYTWFLVATAGSGSSTGSFTGLYSSSGTLLTGSSDIGTALASAGPAQLTLTTAQALAAGSFVWAALLVNMPGMPALRSGVGTTGGPVNVGLTAATARWAVNGTGLTSLPSTFTPSGNSLSGFTFWAGGS